MRDEPEIEKRISKAKAKAEDELEFILRDHTIDYSFNQERTRRQTDNDLKLRPTKISAVTTVNQPLGSEVFLVTIE